MEFEGPEPAPSSAPTPGGHETANSGVPKTVQGWAGSQHGSWPLLSSIQEAL